VVDLHPDRLQRPMAGSRRARSAERAGFTVCLSTGHLLRGEPRRRKRCRLVGYWLAAWVSRARLEGLVRRSRSFESSFGRVGSFGRSCSETCCVGESVDDVLIVAGGGADRCGELGVQFGQAGRQEPVVDDGQEHRIGQTVVGDPVTVAVRNLLDQAMSAQSPQVARSCSPVSVQVGPSTVIE